MIASQDNIDTLLLQGSQFIPPERVDDVVLQRGV